MKKKLAVIIALLLVIAIVIGITVLAGTAITLYNKSKIK